MNDTKFSGKPIIHPEIESKSEEIGFTMPSDLHIGSLLKTLITSKPNSNLLELGTGVGLSLSWMIDGMDSSSKLITIDNDPQLTEIAKNFFESDDRVEIICADASQWLKNYSGEKFDLIFADAWPGKYSDLDLTLDLLKTGGFYIIDDMLEQPNWPEGHDKNAEQLIRAMEGKENFNLTKLNWSTGIIIATKKH